MAKNDMIPCPSCGTVISTEARSCPNCGRPMKKPRRGFFGKLTKWTFILFNLLMAYILFAGLAETGNLPEAQSEAEEAGRAIGTTIGVTFILGFWALGSVILGLLTLLSRPK